MPGGKLNSLPSHAHSKCHDAHMQHSGTACSLHGAPHCTDRCQPPLRSSSCLALGAAGPHTSLCAHPHMWMTAAARDHVRCETLAAASLRGAPAAHAAPAPARARSPGPTRASPQPGACAARLDGGAVALEPDDLADQGVVADAHQLVHGGARHVFRHHDGPRHLPDVPAARSRLF